MDKNKYLITLRPKNEQLKKVIAYYYFHVSTDDNNEESFHFYPNYQHALTIYIENQPTTNYNSNQLNTIENTAKKKITSLFTINKKDKILVNIRSPFHKIGVVFYPLGFNHFIDSTLEEVMQQNTTTRLNLGESFNKSITEITIKTDVYKQLEILENELLKLYRPFNENILSQVIKEIILTNGTIKVCELEHNFHVNRKTLLRQFKKHTLTTIEEYKKMVMFRNSLNYALQNKESVNLTDIALYTMYYDQSHFIKHFKSITKETPKTLLPKIAKLGNEDLYWHFVKNK